MSNLKVNPIYTYGKIAAKWAFDKIPSKEFCGKTLHRIKWIGQHITSPQNRLILGATALMSQPFIDLHNRNVDEDTRKVSAARTVAKILVGTTTGFLVRYGIIKAIDTLAKNPKDVRNTINKLLLPSKFKNSTVKVIEGLKQYKFALGTFISLGVMLVTNFLIDAPLTKILTNVFIKKIKNHEKSIIDKHMTKLQSQPQLSDNTLYITKRPNMDSFIKKQKEGR